MTAPTRARLLLPLVALALGCAGPGTSSRGSGGSGGSVEAARAPIEWFDATSLTTSRDDWSGPREGTVWLRRVINASVDVEKDARDAVSHVRHHLVRTRFGDGADEPFVVLAPRGARVEVSAARVLGAAGPRAVQPGAIAPTTTARRVDPDQLAWAIEIDGVAAEEIVELVADVTIPGTLVGDAHWLGAAGGPTADVLVRWNVPSGTAATIQVRHSDAKPVVAEQGGATVMAVHATNVSALSGRAGPHARYVTRSASIRGHRVAFATGWPHIARPWEAELLQESLAYRGHHKVPLTPTSAAQGFTWVRDRLQRADALEATWRDGRLLAALITANDLQGTDKVHLLHWLLDAGGIDHRVAVARSRVYPTLDPAFATPGVVDRALVYLPASDQWLDPACQSCDPGQVRPALRGGQAFLLPVAGETVRPLPE